MTKTWSSSGDWGITIHIGSGHPPVFQQIVDQISYHIAAGNLKTGDKLPTVRELAHSLDINFNTVAKAYHDLVRREIMIGRKGGGSLIAEKPPMPAEYKEKKIKQLIQNLFSEAASYGVTTDEIRKYIKETI
jgi:GntR family transcriptional regulator